jgi:4-hydroxybenzoate polyprenyltransferase
MTKNAFCLAGVLFSGRFVSWESDLAALQTFAAFCAGSSAVYVFNDIFDRERDRKHPRKQLRPIASGAVSVPAAVMMAIALAALGFALAALLNLKVTLCLALYLVNNVLYSLGLKHLALFDVLSIAVGFVLRLVAGVYAINELPTDWIALCTFFLAVFLGFAKRRAELAGLLPDEEKLQRPVLSKYSVQFLDYLVNNSAVMVVVCYALFTATSNKNPTLVITVPIVFFAVMHYKRLVLLLRFGEEPEKIVLRDLRLQLSIIIWLITYFGVIYGDIHLFRSSGK